MGLILKRFSEGKQDQIEQLIGYATMLGLTGTDLVAIGGKIEREKKKEQRIANKALIAGFEILPVGKRNSPSDKLIRFKLKTANGAYNFERIWADQWEVTSLRTKAVLRATISQEYELTRGSYDEFCRNCVLLEIVAGNIKLNF